MKTVVKLRKRRYAAKETKVNGDQRETRIAIFNSRKEAEKYNATGEGQPELLGWVNRPVS